MTREEKVEAFTVAGETLIRMASAAGVPGPVARFACDASFVGTLGGTEAVIEACRIVAGRGSCRWVRVLALFGRRVLRD